MADYGLIQGLAEGIKSGLSTYDDVKKAAADRAMKERSMKAQELTQGIAFDPTTGAVSRTPESQRKYEFENAAYDPNSERSQRAQQLNQGLLKGSGLEDTIPLGSSSAELKEQEPLIQHALTAKTAAEARKEAAELNRPIREAAAEQKRAGISQKLVTAMKDDLDPNKARGGNLAKSQSVINSAERIEGLMKQFPDGNIPKAQTVELATSVAGLLSGGSPQSQHQIDLMVPSSIRGDSQAIASWITNEPRGQDQQEFMKLLAETTQREKQVAADQVRKAQTQRLSAHGALKKLDPDSYNAVLNAYGLGQPQEQGLIMGNKTEGGLIPSAQAASKLPQVGEVRKGFSFKGGDPSDPKRWERTNAK